MSEHARRNRRVPQPDPLAARRRRRRARPHTQPPTLDPARPIVFSEGDLAEQMLAFIETYNQTAKPFKWTYAGKVLEA